MRDKAATHVMPDVPCGWIIVIPGLGLAGIVASLFYVSQIPGGSRWTVFGTALAIAGASSFTGGIVGFLFGIPRTVPVANGSADSTRYQGNTNLEQVSDWLSKIIVGVGLVQLGRLLPALGRLAQSLNVPLGGQPSSASFGLALISAYALLGFLFLYLWSRERLPRELHVAETVDRELDAQESTRLRALMLVSRQLDALKGGVPPSQEELNQAVVAVPGSTRLLLFTEAERIRAANWQDPDRKGQMELAIPVFRALIAADAAGRYHRIRGSLGWALKDKRDPDWEAAFGELNMAIEIRDRQHLTGWKMYEATRALCAIHILSGLAPGNPRQDRLRQAVRHDLAAASHDRYAARMLSENAEIQSWESLERVPV
jgi:hypothetical protein